MTVCLFYKLFLKFLNQGSPHGLLVEQIIQHTSHSVVSFITNSLSGWWPYKMVHGDTDPIARLTLTAGCMRTASKTLKLLFDLSLYTLRWLGHAKRSVKGYITMQTQSVHVLN